VIFLQYFTNKVIAQNIVEQLKNEKKKKLEDLYRSIVFMGTSRILTSQQRLIYRRFVSFSLLRSQFIIYALFARHKPRGYPSWIFTPLTDDPGIVFITFFFFSTLCQHFFTRARSTGTRSKINKRSGIIFDDCFVTASCALPKIANARSTITQVIGRGERYDVLRKLQIRLSTNKPEKFRFFFPIFIFSIDAWKMRIVVENNKVVYGLVSRGE